jgi:hypothetical protein
MKRFKLPSDLRSLVRLAEQLANVVGDKADELRWEGVEISLRVGLAAASFANSAYVAMLANATESVTAARFLARAKVLRSSAEQRLREELRQVISRLCDVMTMDEVLALAGHIHSLSKD